VSVNGFFFFFFLISQRNVSVNGSLPYQIITTRMSGNLVQTHSLTLLG
jgi:hypothetical protein